MFEITPQDIALLDDKQLRTLVALLCEAELRSRGYSTVAVTWGGNQNAKDGGLDVRVDLPSDKFIDGFIPRRSTGFQVKRQDMPPRAIVSEMCPKGELRPTIRELAKDGGAYVIVSSDGSTADIALTNRKKAMVDAVSECADDIVLDFYDRTRLATWVRNHAGLVVWVRREIGRAIPGWEAFGPWAFPAGGEKAEYLLDKGVQICDRAARGDDLSAEEGLRKIRGILRKPASVVRLVGLSGVGKTRFVQALFDSRIGDDALNPALVVYTNMNNEPSPQPFSLASDLIANGTRTILVVDNCASDLHGRLAALVKDTASQISVLTVEYDIQDDLPEGTEVFEIKAASVDLIEKLLKFRFPALSPVDVKTAAEVSGGNARIAIAIAETVGRGGTLAKLNDTQLFERLFVQRQGKDRSLLEMAQACSLVFSFNGDDVSDGNDAELFRISALVGKTADHAHRNVAELLRRNLAQRRGRWRAVLPHALANRLAETALQNIPSARIHEFLLADAPQRLIISFSRRLGYLDGSQEAIAIVNDWLGPEGWIGEHVWNLSEFGQAVFRNCLPVTPEAGLQALEANLPTFGAEVEVVVGEYVPRTLRSLAWDATLFERCVSMLRVLAIHGPEAVGKKAQEIHVSLFFIYLSGTHASVEQRISVVRGLLGSSDEQDQNLGADALNAMLKSHDFISHYDFNFGARSRDYGYQPKTSEAVKNWYFVVMETAKEFALSDSKIAGAVRSAIASNFRSLWSQVGLHDNLEGVVVELAGRKFWADGWRAVRQTLRYDKQNKESENYVRLLRLKEILRPRDLVERVQGQVLGSRYHDFVDFDDDGVRPSEAFRRFDAEIVLLGRDVASDATAFEKLLSEIIEGEGAVWSFGRGLAQGTQDAKWLWQRLVSQFSASTKEKRNIQVLCGFLAGLSSQKSLLLDEFLDLALIDEPLAPHFPILQTAVTITSRGMKRLTRSIELGRASVDIYSSIVLGDAIEVVPAIEIAEYIAALAKLPNGEISAIHTLSMQFHSDRQANRAFSPEIVKAGRNLLSGLDFERFNRRDDYHLHEILEICGRGDDGADVARKLCENLKRAVAAHRTYGFQQKSLLKGLFKVQPKTTLDALLNGDQEAIERGLQLISDSAGIGGNPIDEISDDTLFDWCQQDPINRFPIAAAIVSAFALTSDDNPSDWNPIALKLVHNAPDPIVVMKVFIDRLQPMMWSGSKSTILTSNATLLDTFDARGNASLAALVLAGQSNLREEARRYFDWENKRDQERDERFE